MPTVIRADEFDPAGGDPLDTFVPTRALLARGANVTERELTALIRRGRSHLGRASERRHGLRTGCAPWAAPVRLRRPGRG